ncbi:MAG TPA: metallophosphoesterase [Dehalococcoidia bacterium]|nr:metallophosphoesterase [Dehalococcoidia bacterium]
MTRRPLRLLHTSDLHIGANRVDPHLNVLKSVLDLGAAAKADGVLMAGDIFDNNRIEQGLLDDAVSVMAASRLPITILPGNHDCLLEGGVYDRGAFWTAGITVLGATHGELASFDRLNLVVWGRPHRDHKDLLPLRDVPECEERHWRVNVAHGHWVKVPEDERRAYRIFDADLEAQAADYLALGHWDVFTRVESSSPAYYSGSPFYSGSVNIVELEEGSPLRVSRLRIE